MHTISDADRLKGTLVGTAIGDALGLYVENLSAKKIQRRFGRVDRFLMPCGIGLLSDDTEQSALLAEALLMHPRDVQAFRKRLQWSLAFWFWTLPPGIGKATMMACLRMSVGLRDSGVHSAGNGSAMRASIIGSFFKDNPERRLEYGTAAATVTHTDERAIAAALFVAELAAACANSDGEQDAPPQCFEQALSTVSLPALAEALKLAQSLAKSDATIGDAAQKLGTSGFVMHTVPFAAFCFLQHGSRPMEALSECIGQGGDTDSNAAILGAWLGALHGTAAFPAQLRNRLAWTAIPFDSLSHAFETVQAPKRHFNYVLAFLRNVVVIPVILLIALTRFVY